MSAPALKARPAPVMTIARTERSNSIESSAGDEVVVKRVEFLRAVQGEQRDRPAVFEQQIGHPECSCETGSHGRSRGRSRQANSTHPHVSRIHHPVSQSLAKYQYGGLRASLHSHSLLSDDSNPPFANARVWASAV